MIFCTGSSRRDEARSGRRCSCSAISAMRAERLEDRTAEKVAIANTSVPAAVANEEAVTQLMVRRIIGRQSGSGHLCWPLASSHPRRSRLRLNIRRPGFRRVESHPCNRHTPSALWFQGKRAEGISR